MRVQLTAESIEWMRAHKISLHNRGAQRLKVGDRIYFNKWTEIEPYVEFGAGNVMCSMGTMSYSNSSVAYGLTVGRYSSIGENFNVLGVRHPIEYISTSNFTYDNITNLTKMFIQDHGSDYRDFFECPQKSMPHIGNDVWIGANVTLARGITLGTGSVIAANSVVVKPVGPYEIVGGNPARVIRKRFPDEMIKLLLESEWWRYKFIDFAGLDLSDPGKFLEGFFKRKLSLEPYAPRKVRLSDMPHS